MIVLYRKRRLSYDHDWKDALHRVFGARLVRVDKPDTDAVRNADVVIMLHSTNAPKDFKFRSRLVRALKERKGKLIWFMGNEFRDVDRKVAWCDSLGADLIASMGPDSLVRERYGERGIMMPHALNERAFRPVVPRTERPHDLGYRGTVYPAGLGDEDRRRIIALAAEVPGADVCEGETLGRAGWAAALNAWRATVTTEAGRAGEKCMSSRHMDAVGTMTVQIALPGHYNGILQPHHYIPCDLERGLEEPLRRAADEGDSIAERALSDILSAHTYDHRMAELGRWL